MAELVNLRRFRKAKARQEKAAIAAENRIKFGRTVAEKNRLKAERERADINLDGVRREPPTNPSDADGGQD